MSCGTASKDIRIKIIDDSSGLLSYCWKSFHGYRNCHDGMRRRHEDSYPSSINRWENKLHWDPEKERRKIEEDDDV